MYEGYKVYRIVGFTGFLGLIYCKGMCGGSWTSFGFIDLNTAPVLFEQCKVH